MICPSPILNVKSVGTAWHRIQRFILESGVHIISNLPGLRTLNELAVLADPHSFSTRR
jgi:hypothetical protein